MAVGKKLTPDIATVVYYSASTEPEPFASNIRSKLLEVIGDLPLISVTQKPIDFGKNICVGDVGVNEFNEWRQVLIGCEEATTPFIIVAEADDLYPPDYFNFTPPKLDRVYRYSNIWILRNGRPFYLKKEYTEGAQIIGREHFINILNEALKGHPRWCRTEGAQISKLKPVFKPHDWDFFGGDPVVSFKTGHGMRKHTSTMKNTKGEYSIPYWGLCTKLDKEIYEGS